MITSFKTEKTFLQSLCIFVLCTFFSSCYLLPHKKEDPELPYYNDQEFKDYTFFPAGSYWVYVDSASGAEDSMCLMTQDVNMYDGTYHNEHPYERFENHYSTSYYNGTDNGYNGTYDGTVYETSNILKYDGSPSFSVLWQRISIATSNLYFSQSKVNDVLVWNHNLQYAAFSDSIILSNGIQYKNVKKFVELERIKGAEPITIKGQYYAKGIGMIRKELYNGEVWNLQRYHISVK